MSSILGRIGHFTTLFGLLMLTSYMLSILGRIGHFWAIQAFNVDQLDVIYTRLDRSFYCAIQAFNVDQLDVIYTGPDRSFSAPFGLFKWTIAKIDRECFKESFIDNTSSRLRTFSDLSPRLVIISLWAFNITLQFLDLSCLFLLLSLHALTPMEELLFWRLDHWVA